MAIFNLKYLEEATNSTENQKVVNVSINGKSYKAELDIRKSANENLVKNIKDIVKLVNFKSVFDSLYSHHKAMLEEIDEEDGGPIKSGKDLMNTITSIDLVTIKYDTVYVSGTCEWDIEHGFSISLPGGKFVKPVGEPTYSNDYDKSNHYQPRYTVLSGHASAY